MNRRSLALPVVLLLVVVAGVAAAARPTKRLDDADRGKQLYDRHCVACHGLAAAGDGAATAALVAKVPDLRGGKLTDANQEAMVVVVLEGRGAMPSFETSFDRYDARRVLRHMQAIASGATDAKTLEKPKAEPEPPRDEEE